jgi:hypothetical protein
MPWKTLTAFGLDISIISQPQTSGSCCPNPGFVPVVRIPTRAAWAFQRADAEGPLLVRRGFLNSYPGQPSFSDLRSLLPNNVRGADDPLIWVPKTFPRVIGVQRSPQIAFFRLLSRATETHLSCMIRVLSANSGRVGLA